MLPAAKTFAREFTDRTQALPESELAELWQLLTVRVAEQLQEGQLIDLALPRGGSHRTAAWERGRWIG